MGDGSTEWGPTGTDCFTAPAVPGPCWVPDNQLPRGVNPFKGYYATANSDPAGYTGHTFSPFGSSIDSSLYSYLSFDWSDPTDVRYARIADVLLTKTTNGGKVSLDDMQKLQSDHAVLLAKLFEDRYPSAAVVNQANYTAARDLLTQWGTDHYDCPTGLSGTDPKSAAVTDATQLRDSAACLLFHDYAVHAAGTGPKVLTRTVALADVVIIVVLVASIFGVVASRWGRTDVLLGRVSLDDPAAQQATVKSPIGPQGLVYIGLLGLLLGKLASLVLPGTPTLLQVALARGVLGGVLAFAAAGAGYVRGAVNARVDSAGSAGSVPP